MAIRDMLKISTTLKELNLSNNEIGAYARYNDGRDPWVSSPEGPAALAEGLAANSSVTQVNVRDNRLDQKTKDLLSKTNKKVTFDM